MKPLRVSWTTFSSMYKRRIRRALLGVPLVLSGIGVIIHLGFTSTGNGWPPEPSSGGPNSSKSLHRVSEVDAGSIPGVVGIPQMIFRDNLLPNTSYITSWGSGGMTNQFISHVNMIYLAILSNRVPVLPPFIPTGHVVLDAEIFPFSDIFDLAYLRRHLRRPILEWKDIKHIHSSGYADDQEPLGCWTTTEQFQRGPGRVVRMEAHLGLDVAYLKVPLKTRKRSDTPDHEIHVVFSHLAALIYPEKPDPPAESDEIPHHFQSPKGYTHAPDTHLVCFDSLYYATSGTKEFEWYYTWSPAWRFVGRAIPFTRSIQKLAKEYIMRTFGVPQDSDAILPTFIAVHVRRSDFVYNCEKSLSAAQCSPPLSVYSHYVREIKNELQERLNITVTHILGLSDDESEEFGTRMRNEGWFYVNHTQERTVGRYGRWYPSILDMAMMSMGTGLVGTKGSTVSLVAGKRVQDWNNGAYREVDIWTDWRELAAEQP